MINSIFQCKFKKYVSCQKYQGSNPLPPPLDPNEATCLNLGNVILFSITRCRQIQRNNYNLHELLFKTYPCHKKIQWQCYQLIIYKTKCRGGGYKFTLYIYKCRYAESLRGLDSCGHFQSSFNLFEKKSFVQRYRQMIKYTLYLDCFFTQCQFMAKKKTYVKV